MAKAIQGHRDELLDLAVANGGNTRSDAKFDVDGAIFTLQTYAEIGTALAPPNFSSTEKACSSGARRAFTAST